MSRTSRRRFASDQVVEGARRFVAAALALSLLATACVQSDEPADDAAETSVAESSVAETSVAKTSVAEDSVTEETATEPAPTRTARSDPAPSADDDERARTPIPLPTPDTSGRPIGAALLRQERPIQSAEATAAPTLTPAPTTAPAPTDTPTVEASPTPVPTTAPAPTPVGDAGLGALRTPTGVIAGIVGGSDGAWEIVSPCNNVVTVASGQLLDRPIVLIDPGHGGSEIGAAGPNGLAEKDLNLNVAKRLESWLTERNIAVLLTRESDYRMALRARTALSNAVRPTIFVSIHHNGGSSLDLDTPPTEVFYQDFSADSKRLAGLIYEELEEAMTPVSDSWRGTPFEGAQPRFNTSGETLYGILRRAEAPTVISEPFYLDNAHGEELANDPAVLAIETEALGAAIVRYLSTDDQGSGFVEGDQFTLGNSSGGSDGCVDPPLE